METTPPAALTPTAAQPSGPTLAAATDERRSATASRRRRVFAWLIDYVVVMLPGLAVVFLGVSTVLQSLPGYIGAVGATAGWSRVAELFTHRDASGIGGAAVQEWRLTALPLMLSLAAVPLLQFLYQAILLGWRRRTIGMVITDIRVDAATPGTRLGLGAALRRAAMTTFVETGIIAMALLLMVLGMFQFGAIAWGAAVALFWLDAFVAFGRRRRTLIDRLAGATVVRTSVYASVAGVVAAGAVSASRHGATLATAAVRTAAEATSAAGRGAVVAGRALSDAAAVSGDLARQGAEALAGSAPVRQALDSRTAAQAQAIAAAGAERAREIGGRAAERTLELGSRARELWRDRRARRSTAGPAELAGGPADVNG